MLQEINRVLESIAKIKFQEGYSINIPMMPKLTSRKAGDVIDLQPIESKRYDIKTVHYSLNSMYTRDQCVIKCLLEVLKDSQDNYIILRDELHIEGSDVWLRYAVMPRKDYDQEEYHNNFKD